MAVAMKSSLPTIEARISWALLNRKVFRDAYEKESIDPRSAEKIVKRLEKRLIEKEKKRRVNFKCSLSLS
ncbi:hypothetical protein BYT27DRAFT_6876748 [Phlegmacium glaucopus]|nr:hypothetical protein BYT27DRAFT_6876748 [Phlegmacium glaucopus]